MQLVFALTGQSNMQGPAPQPSTWPSYANAGRMRKFSVANEVWEPASEPLHHPTAGVGPGMAFADRMIELLDAQPKLGWQPGVSIIGLIPCAIGGSASANWVPIWLHGNMWSHTHAYGTALRRITMARAQEPAGVLAGLIDYQGESDTFASEMVLAFIQNKRAQIQGFRQDLGIFDLPTIVTQLGPDPATANPPNLSYPAWTQIQTAMTRTAEDSPHRVKVITASDLGAGWDGNPAHLTPDSMRVLGYRYADVMHVIL